jgi:REP element-mobilizing transposase RayT
MRSDVETRGDLKNGRGAKQKDSEAGRPDIFKETRGNVRLEPVAKRDYDLSYACLLIPRASEHFLGPEVQEFLDTTLKQICKFFGWRLDFIQVQPEYLQWVVSAPAATTPSRCIHTIREQTSKGILEKFSQFRDSKPSQDFWAPGYLVLVGTEPHSKEIIKEFIMLTRLQQGLRPRSEQN